MPVGDCQRAFGKAATRDGVTGLTTGSVAGLTDRGHFDLELESSARAPLQAIFEALGGDQEDLEAGPHRPLPVDWLIADARLIIEIDESQHFTSERLVTLDLYPSDAVLSFDVSEYRSLCRILRAGSDRYRADKPARGFRRPGGRRAQRAYFDAVRDLGAPTLGWRVFRVPAGHGDGAAAYREHRRSLMKLLS